MEEQQQKIEIIQKSYAYELLWNVQHAIQPPLKTGSSYCTRGDVAFFHYGCDNFNDNGWGCAYRTLQSMCSWVICKRGGARNSIAIPSLHEIQKTLVHIGDKPSKFLGSRDWIGACEVFYALDTIFGVPCQIVHASKFDGLDRYAQIIRKYFENFGGFAMLGGDLDAASKGIAGVHISGNETYYLVVDPHFVGVPISAKDLIERGYIRWQHTSEFVDSSFYNFCLPLLK